MYPDEVVGTSEVQLGKDGSASKVFQGCWDEGKWIAEFTSDLVKIHGLLFRNGEWVYFAMGHWLTRC